MHIILFTHPDFTASYSMRLYAGQLKEGMEQRGHTVEEITARAFFSKIRLPKLSKWLGYADQFLLFPIIVKLKLFSWSRESLYVFADHALGPWVPLVKKRAHIVHCHDFIAQKSAQDSLPENSLGLTGKWYQRFIRYGYSQANNFISISKATQEDLHEFLTGKPDVSEVVYNGLNKKFKPGPAAVSRRKLSAIFQLDLHNGYVYHIGGNNFYKNRKGVIGIYNAWRKLGTGALPLLLAGLKPDNELLNARVSSPFSSEIHFLCDVEDSHLEHLYRGASVMLFPSLEEGFGWPIAEAQACGCPVMTTNKAPMNEVGGSGALYIKRKIPEVPFDLWAQEAAQELDRVLHLPDQELQTLKYDGFVNAKRFDTQKSLNAIEQIYKLVLLNKRI